MTRRHVRHRRGDHRRALNIARRLTAMLKPDSDRYSAHDAEFFQHVAVAAASRNI
ncbi:hypothetical protein [Bradyrhizobium sp. CCBAU 53338]|uniref:hypothetical protein n=1 Tax=Bradyrhizobium sp. CCBAU 53338 TaxID=1325111 RepID=UPI00188D15DA|nr:hypothetical protein [Bradyrhizobium sp. CCBAU 53338]